MNGNLRREKFFAAPAAPARVRVVAQFAFATEVRVRFAETDAQGIAHNSTYLVWFELARVEYLERFAGGYPALRARGIEAFVTEAHVRYGAPARFDDRLKLRTSCRDVRGARFRFEYVLDRDGERVADGWTAHACVDARTFRPTRVPEWLAAAIARAEASPSGEPSGSPEPPPPVR
jgi:acyl-CoA thioester hydrolase